VNSLVKEINEIQELQFRLMRKASFNLFDGDKVVDSLIEHKDLWKGVVMARAGYNAPEARDFSEAIDLICLRDIESNIWNVDTVYILPEPGKEKELYKLAKTWDADEVNWLSSKVSQRFLGVGGDENLKILRVWWD